MSRKWEGRKTQTILFDVLGDPGVFVFVWFSSLFLSRFRVITAFGTLVIRRVCLLPQPEKYYEINFFWSMFNNFVLSRDFIRQIMSKEFPLLRAREVG